MQTIINIKSLKLNRIKLKLFFLLGLVTVFLNAQELTLKQAHDLMLANNGDTKASSFEVKAMEEEHKATKGLRLPTVSVSGTYLHLDEDISVDLNTQRNMVGGLLSIPNPAEVLGDWNLTLQEKNLGFATADVSMPIFAGGKINAANKASEIKLKKMS
jgi:outer membrane protein TolC